MGILLVTIEVLAFGIMTKDLLNKSEIKLKK